MIGKFIFACAMFTLVFNITQHLRNNIARATNHHFVTNPQAQTFNLIGVMQRGVTHQHARDLHRLKTGDRGNGARTADLELHVANEGHLFLSRKLKRHRPARRTCHKPELLLKRQ